MLHANQARGLANDVRAPTRAGHQRVAVENRCDDMLAGRKWRNVACYSIYTRSKQNRSISRNFAFPPPRGRELLSSRIRFAFPIDPGGAAPVYKTCGRDPRAKVELFFSMFIEDLAWK